MENIEIILNNLNKNLSEIKQTVESIAKNIPGNNNFKYIKTSKGNVLKYKNTLFSKWRNVEMEK